MRHVTALFLLCGFVVAHDWRQSTVATTPTPQAQDKGAAPDKKRPPQFTIGKDTTYVTGPVDKDGYIDYTRALNERLREGVTPENNACALLWKALGPNRRKEQLASEFFKMLGVQEPPEEGEYFIDALTYMEKYHNANGQPRPGEVWDEVRRTTTRSWANNDYPRVAGWLKANDKPLVMIVEATKRSQYYLPLWPAKGDGHLGFARVLFAAAGDISEIGRALASRAMLRLEEGHDDAAWQDLIACHRLGRLMARGKSFIEYLSGSGIDYIASEAELAFLDRAKLDATKLMKCLQELKDLPEMPNLADAANLGERFLLLDCVMRLENETIGELLPFTDTASFKNAGKTPPMRLTQEIFDHDNRDSVLRNSNLIHDRVAAAMRLKDRGAREKQLGEIATEIKNADAKMSDFAALAKAIIGADSTPDVRGKLLTEMLVVVSVPNAIRMQHWADRDEQRQRNLHLAFALAAYQRDHGNYPKKLEDLAPKYLATIPQDLFTGKALVYQPSANGYLLYSFGVNGRDDQGRGYDDDPPGDDLSVRMPLPLPK